jgi:putative transposase
MARLAAFRFTALDDPRLAEEVRRHMGARRFAYNRCLEVVKDKLVERRARPDVDVPWSGYSLINWWNAWKRSEDAGRRFAVGSFGRAELVDQGLSWRSEVCAQVFEEAAVDLGRALSAFSASKKGARRGERVGFPHFLKKGQGSESFRLRNKVSPSGRSSIRVGEEGSRSLADPPGDRPRGAARGHAAPAALAAPGVRRGAAGQDLFGHGVAAAGSHRRHPHLRTGRPAPGDAPSERQ